MLLLEHKRTKGILDTIHFVGIGGIGMSGIAEIMHNLGYRIQGSDSADNANTQRLKALGIKVFKGHAGENVANVSYVVVSSAILSDNPEVIEALAKKIPVIKRSEMLAELMRFKCSVAISGSHGKTTTTSIIACLFEAAGLHPTVINGGIINHKSTNAYVGSGNYLVAEADESDATFIKIPSTIAVITNIDPEHLDFYKSFDNLIDAFKKFITNLPFYGFAVCCADHKIVRQVVDSIVERKIITYGIDSEDANVRATNIVFNVDSSTFDVEINLPNVPGTTTIEEITVPTPGRHNVLNALAAISVGIELDFGIKTIKDGLHNFQGVKRRFTKTGEYNGASIIDDYAHHPVEIKATIATARIIADRRKTKIIGVFQPHRYTRLHNLFNEFCHCFEEVDELYIMPVYSAGESPIEGANSEALVSKIRELSPRLNAKLLKDVEEIKDMITKVPQTGDLVLMMGAGSISTWANEIPAQLKSQSSK